MTKLEGESMAWHWSSWFVELLFCYCLYDTWCIHMLVVYLFLPLEFFCWFSYFSVPSLVFECRSIVLPPSCPQSYILPPGFWWFSSMELVTLRLSIFLNTRAKLMHFILLEFINAFLANFLFLHVYNQNLFPFFSFFMPLFLPKPPFRVFNLASLP